MEGGGFIGLMDLLITKYFQKLVMQRKGIILNIASDLSVIAPDQRLANILIHQAVTIVIKHGMVGLTKFLAYFANITLELIYFTGGIFNKQDKKFVKINQLIFKRMAKHGEYKEIIQFLCSDASSYLTGQNIVIDGEEVLFDEILK